MKKIILFGIVTLLLFSVSSLVYAGPRSSFSEKSYDFGYVPQHAKISHNFVITSTGSDSLKIIKVVPGCGCTKAPLEKSELAVGESTNLEIIFDTRSYTNIVKKAPRVLTNEGPNQQQILFTANVVKDPSATFPVVIKPYKLDLTMMPSSSNGTYQFTIENVSDKAVALNLVDQPEKSFVVSLPDKIEAGKTVSATITLVDVNDVSKMEKSFTFETNNGEVARFTVPVYRKGGVIGQK